MTQVLRQLTHVDDPNILIGPDTADDVGAYRISETSALVMTTDFFAPVVDDPYWFGAIAAANSLSDMYAKGVQPVAALNLVAFPSKKLSMNVLSEILRGGGDKVREAGAAIIGGHSVDDDEPKYGLAVVGLTHPDAIIRNSTARPGDILVLTKPLGIGIITTAIKRDLADTATMQEATRLMATLNHGACRAMLKVGVHAATDITGYGLLGHLREMLAASGAGASVHLPAVPVLPPTWELVEKKAVPGGSRNNLTFLNDFIDWPDGISWPHQIVLCDAQTSGGLLIAVSPKKVDRLLEELSREKTPAAAIIGEVTSTAAGRIRVQS
jgi:selenide,water dikinase